MRKLFLMGALLLAVPALNAREFTEDFVGIKAGMINYVEGSPLLFGSAATRGKPLGSRAQVSAGDRIETRASERFEMLLNPGGYLRLGPNSRLLVLSTAFESMHFELTQGTAIVESAAFNRKVHGLKVTTPAGDVVIWKDGLYRFEVGSRTEVLVFKGKAKWLKDNTEVAMLKSGKRFNLGASASDGSPQFARLSKDGDELDRWSRRRAEFLVAANGRLSPWLLGRLPDIYSYNFRGGWLYNPYFSCYTFVPFDGRYGSPYGFSYGLFLPVRVFPRYEDDSRWSAWNGGGSYPQGRSTTYEQRQTVTTAPSAPAARAETGQSEQNSRSATFGRVSNR